MNENYKLDQNYGTLVADLKKRVAESRYKATLSINKELVLLYNHIGQQILKSQKVHGWGAKVIEQLSKDLYSAFPEMKGFSSRNLKYMRKFAEEYQDQQIVQQLVAQLPWGHNVVLLDRISDRREREFYIKETIQYGWSRNIMVMQIESNLYMRQGGAVTNFDKRLPNLQSDLAVGLMKDPYCFDFLSLGRDAHEREIEKGLISHMQKFLLELGEGFAFVGSQYHLEVGGQDFFVDMLFYHLKLRCYFVIELKNTAFKPEYSGKLNFYLSVIDDKLKHKDDNPSIGLILCKSKNKVVAEYALRDIEKPIGLSEYKLPEKIIEKLKATLPSIEELEKELSKDIEEVEDVENE
jgi:predicted nuclease of restriction endonuclease-like (RecB) superfamily